jgi:membrane protease YdiL (CAAX protease family)
MDKLKTFLLNHPLFSSVLILALAIGITELPLKALLLPFLGDQSADYLSGILLQFGCGALLLALIAWLGLLPKAGLGAPRPWKELWLVWPLVAFTLLNFLPLLDGSLAIDTTQPGRIGLYSLLMLSIGFLEEILGRGLVLVLLLNKWGGTKRGMYAAVLVSGLLFGAAHIVNLIQNRYALAANLSQIGYSLFFAVAFAACFLRLRSIWPVMLLHAAFDFGGALQEIAVGAAWPQPVHSISGQDALVNILLTLPLLLYGLFILRKTSQEDMGKPEVVTVPAGSR